MLLTNGSLVIGKGDPISPLGDIIRLPIPARKLDIDMMEQKLYWISSEDGVCTCMHNVHVEMYVQCTMYICKCSCKYNVHVHMYVQCTCTCMYNVHI